MTDVWTLEAAFPVNWDDPCWLPSLYCWHPWNIKYLILKPEHSFDKVFSWCSVLKLWFFSGNVFLPSHLKRNNFVRILVSDSAHATAEIQDVSRPSRVIGDDTEQVLGFKNAILIQKQVPLGLKKRWMTQCLIGLPGTIFWCCRIHFTFPNLLPNPETGGGEQ